MRYFAYGSNLCREQFGRRCPESAPISRATLAGYRLTFRGHGHADIVRHRGGIVRGALYEISDRDAAALDRYEGVPTYYHRLMVRVRDDSGQPVWALAYKMNSEYRDAEPSAGYLATIERGYGDWGIRLEAAGLRAGRGRE
jgi:gamma-glutamylcyclotransferase (GGCT)/AIG2-like uncharacterized protein YtfP